MAARKLQQEQERVYKRISEGIASFDQIYDKLELSNNQSQKEKLEQDLKREIKKLQRLRDQLKAWMGSNDVKDKKPLVENRKLIEQQMERFKAVEKEMKTKAFSREGLNPHKNDPREKEKQDTSQFVQELAEELQSQTDSLEMEVESIASTMKKGKKDVAKADRISEIENTIERHRWHIEKMEVMARMVENGTLACESVNDLREDMKYYVESNQDADFAEDEEIYDELNLNEDDEELQEIEYEDEGNSLEDLAAENSSGTVAATAPLAQPTAAVSNTPRKPTSSSSSTQPQSAQTASTSNSVPPSMKPAAAPPKTDMKYASAAQSSIPQGLSPLPPPPAGSQPKNDQQQAAKEASLPNTPATKPANIASAPWAEKLDDKRGGGGGGANNNNNNAPSPSPTPPPQAGSSSPMTPVSVSTSIAPEIPQAPQVTLPPGLQDLVKSFDAARKRIGNPPVMATISKLVSASYINCPDSSLADKPHYYHPESPFPTPPYYPQEPIQLDTEDIVAKMDVDTLFYVFYYRQGTYQQYVAARELKKRSWRFHKRFLTWFQRHEEPETITNDFEQGTYRYFDFEGLWLQRRKSNFKFEYQYLEDEI